MQDEINGQRAQLDMSGEVNAAGEFEVMAITAGEGNGWEWDAAALQESLALWDGAECFVDHTYFRKSLRDLAGIMHSPVWDVEKQGIKCQLRAVGPSAPMLKELGKEMLAEGKKAPRIGFSADVLFTAQGRKVNKLLRVLSVDLVFNPARGGAFLRALNSLQAQGVIEMADEVKPNGTNTQPAKPAGQQAQLQDDLQAVRTLLDVQQEQTRLAQEAEAARAVRAQMCGYLLDSGLAASKLPAPVTARIRKQFDGQVFEPAALTQAIDDARTMVSELTGSGVVQGPGRVHGMFTSEDQMTAALHDMLGADRPEGLKGVSAARLHGARELYTLMTGDYDFVGGYHPERMQLATTADLPGALANVMNKLIIMEWQELGRSGYRWWEPVVAREHFTSLQQISGVLIGEVGVLPTVAEGAPYVELPIEDSRETAAWVKYGGFVGLTLEMFERDETHKLRQFPKKLASAGLRRVSSLVASVFTAAGGVGPNMADGNPVFGVGRGNLGVAALAGPTWELASSAIYNQALLQDPLLPPPLPVQALDAKYMLVPRALRLTGQQILYPLYERGANIHSENMQRGEMGDVITVPEFTDANDWAAVADPKLAPGIIVADRYGVMPEIIVADGQMQGALFTNDEIRMKARHWLAVFVADYRPMYKANVP